MRCNQNESGWGAKVREIAAIATHLELPKLFYYVCLKAIEFLQHYSKAIDILKSLVQIIFMQLII